MMTIAPPIRVCIADTHPTLVRGMMSYLDAAAGDLTVVGSALRVDALQQARATTAFDVLVIDPTALGGAALLADLVATYSHAVVVQAEVLDLQAEVLAAGAPAYLCKTEAPALLVESVRQVARGATYRSPIADELRSWYVMRGERGRSPAQEQVWRRDRGLPVDEDG